MTRTPFTIWQKALMITGVFAVLALSVLAWNVGAGTQLGVTLNLASTAGGLENGLVGHWTFDGKDTINGQINDRSGNGNHGSQVNMATSSAYTQGAIGQAIRTDGINDYIQFPVSAATDAAADDVYSWSAWVFVASTGPSQIIMSATDNDGRGDANTIFEFSVDGTAANFTASVAANNSGAVNSAVTFNKWTHLAGVKNASRLDFYINGTLVGTDTTVNSAAALTPTTFRIGRPNNNTRHFDGATDDARVYTRALSADEVKQLYQLGATTKVGTTPSQPPTKTGLSAGLVGHWTFDGKDVVTGQVDDRSGQNNHASQVNMSSSTAYIIGRIGQGIRLDGINDEIDFPEQTFSGPFTASLWMRTSSTTIFRMVLAESIAGTVSKLGLNATTNHFFVRVVSGGSGDATSASLPSFNEWHHVVLTRNASDKVDIIVDGGTPTRLFSNAAQTGDAKWGRIGNGGSQFYKGDVDDVRLYNRTLSIDEIKQLYQIGATTKVGTTPSQPPTKTGLSAGLVGHWTFDGNDMITGQVNDRSGQGNHGSQTGTATTTFYVSGAIGQAVNFDSVNDKINAGSASVLDDMSPLSLSFWIYPRSIGQSGNGNIIGKHSVNSANPQNGWVVPMSSSNVLGLRMDYGVVGATDDDLRRDTANNSITLGRWQHVLITWDGSSTATNIRIYVNGVETSYGTTQNGSGDRNTDAAQSIAIGNSAGSSRTFDGYMDDVRVYNRVLSSDEAKHLYQMGQ